MTNTSKTIVFFGSGPVAARSLELLSRHCAIEAVVTKPRPPHHRGNVPVIDVAEKLQLPVHTAPDKMALNRLIETDPFKSNLAVLIDFGIIVSQKVINYFPLGIINSHFSLLPEWRGADPITFSILSGQKKTGISLMLLTAGMDEGPLLAQADYDISPKTTTPSLTGDLIDLSDRALKEILPLYRQGIALPADQLAITMSDKSEPTYSRKLTKDDGNIDWHKPAEVIEREIRAYLDWPKSRTTFGKLEIVITSAEVINQSGVAGRTTIYNKQPAVYCSKGALVLTTVKPAGKKEMTGEAFLAGYKSLFLAN